MKRIMAMPLMLFVFVTISLIPVCGQPVSKAVGPMKKHVTEQATFVLYMPEGWKASEGEGDPGKFKTLLFNDSNGHYGVAVFYGVSPTGKDVLALASFFA